MKKRIMMGKRDLVKALHDRQPALSREEIAEVIDGALALIVETVAQGGEVGLHGFGKFRPVARTLRSLPAFAAGKHFLEALEKSPGLPPGNGGERSIPGFGLAGASHGGPPKKTHR